MAILVEGFALVTRLATIDARYPKGWDGFCADRINDRIVNDEDLVGVCCGSRRELREYLGRLVGRGVADAAAILATTELSAKLRGPAEVGAIRAAQAACTEWALVYRYQERCVPWLRVVRAPLPEGGPVVVGCCLAGGPVGELALPEGWTPESAVDPYDEPGDGDEYLPTWHEFVASLSPESKEYVLARGPHAEQALIEMARVPKMFAGRVRPGGKVIERERVERDPDGTERIVTHRWIKL